MKKFLVIMLVAALCSLSFMACSSDELSGEYEQRTVMGSATLKIDSDGTFSYTVPNIELGGGEALESTKVTKGKYTVDGDIITFKYAVTSDLDGKKNYTSTARIVRDNNNKITSIDMNSSREGLSGGTYVKK